MKKYQLVQCHLTKRIGNVVKCLITWLPKKYAIVGRILELKDNITGKWDSGWKVKIVYSNTVMNYEFDKISNQYRETRGISDV